MAGLRTVLTGIALASALVTGGIGAAPPASAAEPTHNVVDGARAHPEITAETIRQAIAEARAARATLELSDVNSSSRLGTGSDIANVAAVLASTAIGNGGGIRCGTKSLRVYPTTNKAPRCA